MTCFVVGNDRGQSTLFPERLDDYVGDDNPVRAIDVFVDELDLERDEEKWNPVFRPHPALNSWNRSR